MGSFVPELRKLLDEAWDLMGEQTESVINRYRNANSNLRIIETAGVEPWPKLFQNLRSTRQAELTESFPAHVVCD